MVGFISPQTSSKQVATHPSLDFAETNWLPQFHRVGNVTLCNKNYVFSAFKVKLSRKKNVPTGATSGRPGSSISDPRDHHHLPGRLQHHRHPSCCCAPSGGQAVAEHQPGDEGAHPPGGGHPHQRSEQRGNTKNTRTKTTFSIVFTEPHYF